jgi:Carboxypeptidase regulatory-like domain
MTMQSGTRRARLLGTLAVASLALSALLAAAPAATAAQPAKGAAAGRVAFASGATHPRANIRFYRVNDAGFSSARGTPDASARASKAGRYRDVLRAGTYAVAIAAPGWARKVVRVTVTPFTATTVEAVTLHRKGVVTGRVTAPGGAGIRRAEVAFTSLATSSFVTVRTTKAGRFRVALAAGSYRQHIDATGFGSGGTDRTVRVRVATTTAERPIALARAGSVSGAVLDTGGAPIPNIPMLAFRGNTEEKTFATDADGTFRLTGLTPGVWRIEYDRNEDSDVNDGLYDPQERYVDVVAGKNTIVAAVTLLGGPAPTPVP